MTFREGGNEGEGVMGTREGEGMVIGRVGTLHPGLDGVRGKGS